MVKKKDYYVTGNTRSGFFSLYKEIIQDVHHAYLIKGDSLKHKSDFLNEVACAYSDEGYPIDYFHCPHHAGRLEGLRVRDLQVVFFDQDMAEDISFSSDLSWSVIDLSEAVNDENFKKDGEKIRQLCSERTYYHSLAYEQFAKAWEVHEKKEELYLSAMDFDRANKVTEKLIATIFRTSANRSGTGKSERLFFGAATPNGAEHFIESITEGVKKRYIIKGRSGSGKSTLMKKVAGEALNKGYSVTYFLCGFDPSSVDMIIIKELGVAILDGTAPHVIEPTRASDEVIDMFKLCMDGEVEVHRIHEIKDIDRAYKEKMKTATNYLKKSEQIQNVIDEYVDAHTNTGKLQTKKEKLLSCLVV